MAEHLTFEIDFRFAPDFIERIEFPPKTTTGIYEPAEVYRNGEIRKNLAGSWDAFINNKCIRQTVGKKGAYAEIDRRNQANMFKLRGTHIVEHGPGASFWVTGVANQPKIGNIYTKETEATFFSAIDVLNIIQNFGERFKFDVINP